MKTNVKKPTWKRLGLGIVQHLAAMGLLVIIAFILFHTYFSVRTINGMKTYYLDPLTAPEEFEDSGLFGDIFHTAVSDITRLVVIKGQMETDGVFDPHKHIDVTGFAERKGAGNGCPISAVYELDDLVKWGKYGLEYTNRAMSMSDFVNYFGNVIEPENFVVKSNGQLHFDGFHYVRGKDLSEREFTEEDQQWSVWCVMNRYTHEQLEDLVFSYIISKTGSEINMTREDDGSLTVYIHMLSNRYEPIENPSPLFEYADNWVEYIQLQQNVVDTVTSLTENYSQYQECYDLYEADKSNIMYAARMQTEDGVKTFTNVPAAKDFSEEDLTDYFSEFRRYLIYYPDSLEFIGNTSLTESDIYAYMSEYQYAYPETTHIWIGVDTGYANTKDAFYHAHSSYNKIVPYIKLLLACMAILAVVWIGICTYLSVTAGIIYDGDEERILYTNMFDHIWIEIMVLLAIGYAYAGSLGYAYLNEVANLIYQSYLELNGAGINTLYGYGYFGGYGFVVSLFFSFFWYSLIRRLRGGACWKDSFVYFVFAKLLKLVRYVLQHRNSVISVLLPYNMFLLVNLIVVFAAVKLVTNPIILIAMITFIVVADALVGMMLFKHNAERIEIVDGINRIREGEVDYKLEAEGLHGGNREMADAVNNIGEGIRNAVRTSMKDEQMKTDLITNVSHDIKTPLTSIINYVDLLKRLDITEEPAKSYIDVLDGKAHRLKQLTDDLVEASKISSGNIELNMEKLNFAELLNQTIGEFSEKLEEKNLQVVFQGSRLPANIYADSRRMWRVVENLFNNICKYAMEGTRVYVDLTMQEGEVEVSIKNISRRQMNIQADELTERFIRGDSSRTTEGSGLGLSIAKSLTQVQGGTFEIQLDGDLFKVILCFDEYVEENLPEEHSEEEKSEEKTEENIEE